MKKRLFIAFLSVIIICLTTFTNPIYATNENVTINSKAAVNQNEPKIATIYLIRHGKTILNQTNRAQGWADGPLTPSGEDLVKRVGRGLANISFVAAYSSDSGRARQTAKLILAENQTKAKDLQLIENKGIREVYFGKFEGEKMGVLWKLAANHLELGNERELFTKGDNPGEVAGSGWCLWSHARRSAERSLCGCPAATRPGSGVNLAAARSRDP